MKKLFRYAALSLLIAYGTPAVAQSFDGGCHNPVIWADVPDPDVIRVGDSFYMVSTTMHLMPGAPIMKSKDLINWETVGYIFDRLTDTPSYDLDGTTAYGNGQWATSLRYNNGKFYALFSPNAQPYKCFIYSTDDPAGKWNLVARTNHFHDSSFLFDDDGRVYVYSGSGDIHLTELDPESFMVKENGTDQVVIRNEVGGLHEGSRAVKHNGKYYVFVISWPAGQPRCQLCYRADTITGPYERCKVLESQFGGFPYVGQGCMVDDTDGNWWGVIFQDRGGVGRVLTLNPVTWKDGWPMLGDAGGKVPATIYKATGRNISDGIVSADDFAGGKKNILWQWNHNPVDNAWSLTDRKGWLRLRTSRIVSNLFMAPNTITQRMEGPLCSGEIKLDISHMKQGDIAGFGAFNGDSGLLSVSKEEDGTYLLVLQSSVRFEKNSKTVDHVDEKEIDRVKINGKTIWLRINADFRPGRDIATFAYSLDGKKWNPVGGDFKMIFDYTRLFMGTRFAIYNYATATTGGYVDVDYFHYSNNTATTDMAAGQDIKNGIK